METVTSDMNNSDENHSNETNSKRSDNENSILRELPNEEIKEQDHTSKTDQGKMTVKHSATGAGEKGKPGGTSSKIPTSKTNTSNIKSDKPFVKKGLKRDFNL
jgi:hypothetical protein